MSRKVAADDIETMVSMAKKGATKERIASEVGYDPRTVYRHLSAAGITKPRPTRAPLEERLAFALELLKSGVSRQDASITAQIHERTLKKRYPEYHWSKKQTGEYSRMVKLMQELERQNG